ncbi:MAG: aminotransferase class I/II-fold pyridoxal phosphate-dependent enzyme [Anaerolineales bacterium]|nr:aminotransferase class I/II-fold pyridoxal phosphate-dependent enzyme [Anaerolineales bacterium]
MDITSRRLENLSPLFFASLNERIVAKQASGLDVIRLDVGSPDVPPDPAIVAALLQSAQEPDRHGYSTHKGPPRLMEAWAQLYRREFGVELDTQNEIVPLLGSKEGIFHLLLALIDPGDVVLIPDPGYPTYTHGTTIAGGLPYFMPLLPERDFLPKLTDIPAEIARKAKIMWLNYPNNPTAATTSLEFFTQVMDFANHYDVLVCHDAAYSLVTYDGHQAASILQAPGAKKRAVEFNSLSKSHNMAGWRVGVAVGNAEALRHLLTIKTHADSGHFLPVLDAAVLAMTADQGWLHERNLVYQQRRDIIVSGLRQVGLIASKPKASLYVWCPLPRDWTSVAFAEAVLENANVSLTPGVVFGKMGEGFVRISLTNSAERTQEAMQRLKEWMNA